MPIVDEPITPSEAQAIHHADQENARLDEERRNTPDGQTASERAMATSAPKSKKRLKAAGGRIPPANRDATRANLTRRGARWNATAC